MWVCFGLVYVEVSEEFEASTGQELERGEQESARGGGGGPWSPQSPGNGAEMFGKGFIYPIEPLPGLGRKGHIESFPPFFPHRCGDRTGTSVWFSQQIPPAARIQGSLVCQNTGEAACGGGSGPSVWLCSCFGFSPACLAVPPRLSWAGRCRLLLSAPAVPGRVCGVWRWWLLLPEPFPSLN